MVCKKPLNILNKCLRKTQNPAFYIYAPVAQLDRVSDSDSEGRAFESHQAYHVGAKFALLRFSLQKNIRPLPCSSFFAKNDGESLGLFASALAVSLLPTNLLQSKRGNDLAGLLFRTNRLLVGADFLRKRMISRPDYSRRNQKGQKICRRHGI